MLKFFRGSSSNFFVWAIVGLLIVGLAGFGIGVGSFTTSNVATVGDREIDAEEFARAVDQEIRGLSSQTARNLTVQEARQFGVDSAVLSRLVNDAALDGEAVSLGLSTGDAAVRERLIAVPAFAGADGAFSREAYTFMLDRIGLSAAEFEALLRREGTRELIAAGVQAGATMPAVATDAVLSHLGERRTFEWIRLDASMLPAPILAPTEAELAETHQADPDRYTRPETRRITYAILDPETIAETIELPEEALRAAYEADPERFTTPERRIVDRIGFGDAEQAGAARARLDFGEIGFDALAAERDLGPAETDLGEVTRAALDPAAATAVFDAPGPGLVGPVETQLGPSIFRINAVLAGAVTPYEEARETLRAELALEEAGDRVFEESAALDDLIAGGATIEEIAEETAMERGELALNAETVGGLADDPEFAALAREARVGEETDLVTLGSGAVVTLRVDAIDPPTLVPLDEIRATVEEDWARAQTAAALAGQAERLAEEIASGTELATLAEQLGVEVASSGPLARNQVAPGLPAALLERVFAGEPGDTLIETDGAGAVLASVVDILPFDPVEGENATIVEGLRAELRDQAAADLLALYTAAVRDAAGVSINQNMIEAALVNLQ